MRTLLRTAMLAVLLTTGCTTQDKPLTQAGSPLGWQTCTTLLGHENMNALRGTMGKGGVEYKDTGVHLDSLTNHLTAMGREWRPGNDYYSTDSIACTIGPADSRQRFTARVGWYGGSMEVITDGPWRPSGGQVLAYWDDPWDVRYAFPCKVSGSHSQQEREVPFSVRLVQQGLDNLGEPLRERLAASLARTMSTRLQCANKPAIPARLATPHSAPHRSHSSPNPTNSPRYSTRPTQASGQAAAPR
jgi:hypothetical protein